MGLYRVGREDVVSVCSGCGHKEVVPYSKMVVGPSWVMLPVCSECNGRRSTYIAVKADESWSQATDGAVERYIAAQVLHKRAVNSAHHVEDWDGSYSADIHNAVDDSIDDYYPTLHPAIERRMELKQSGIEEDTSGDEQKVADVVGNATKNLASKSRKKA